MKYFAGLDVSLQETSVCVVDETGHPDYDPVDLVSDALCARERSTHGSLRTSRSWPRTSIFNLRSPKPNGRTTYFIRFL
ncbi:hypothetical protein NIBR502774_19235 (plasmid) [Rhizobium sp. NIBRBAC000502774]|nr:hypothetical protein NIBR502774_19235 [Rhizobium sp. NIBRBAC000502774]